MNNAIIFRSFLVAFCAIFITGIFLVGDVSSVLKEASQTLRDWHAKPKEISALKSTRSATNVPAQEQEDPAYMFIRAADYHAQGNYKEAFSLLQKSAEQGDAEAQSGLAAFYSDGKVVSQDYNKARIWYEKAAMQGERSALFYLGILYRDGKGGEQDASEAVKWLTQAALAHWTGEAEYELGVLYFNGNGTPKDYLQAKSWWEKAAEKGSNLAEYALGILYFEGGSGVEKDYPKAREWWEKSANSQNADSQYMLGYIYHGGVGIERNYVKAREWWEKAASNGNAQAKYGLGILYQDGLGVRQDLSMAKKWLTESCNSNNEDACKNLKELQQATPTPRPVKRTSPHYYGADITARYANELALEIERRSNHPACGYFAANLRSLGNSSAPEFVRQRQVEAMIDKLPSICY